MKKILPVLIYLLLFTQNLYAINCDNIDETMATRSGGRVKPLYVLSKETVDFLFSDKASLSAVKIFCSLSFLQLHDFPEKSKLQFKIEHPDAKKFLKLSTDLKGIPIEHLLASEEDLRRAYFSRNENDGLKKEFNKLLNRLQTYHELTQGQLWTVSKIENNITDWIPLNAYFDVWKTQDSTTIEKFLTLSNEKFEEFQPKSTHLLEHKYFKWRPYVWALITTLLGLFLLVTLPTPKLGILFSLFTILIQTIAIIARVYISGRAPITNMYETVIFSGFGALSISLILYYFKKDKIYVFSGLAYNFLTLLMSIFANNMLSPSITPLVPVLRDNFWLSTHVTAVILSYAALSVSWILANLVLLQSTFNIKMFHHYKETTMIPLIYNCVKIGVVLLSAGVILGGIWADYSWGRFWGWDPKETWSLIVLLIYMAILHGKYTSWISYKRFVPLIAVAFLSVLMAWFGVNYILATGLHSYGFSEGGAIFLTSMFMVQFVILTFYYTRKKLISSKEH